MEEGQKAAERETLINGVDLNKWKKTSFYYKNYLGSFKFVDSLLVPVFSTLELIFSLNTRS